MPQRKPLSIALFGGVLLGSVSAASHATEWNGSYDADGVCYCVGDSHPRVVNKILPTPIGGQSVQQICRRVGEGPGLKLADGVFNYMVFNDSQCGHGPFPAGEEPDRSCLGFWSLEKDGCSTAGSTWDLQSAYSSFANANRVTSANQATNDEASQTVNTREQLAEAEAAAISDTGSDMKLLEAGKPVVNNGPRYLKPSRVARSSDPELAAALPGNNGVADGKADLVAPRFRPPGVPVVETEKPVKKIKPAKVAKKASRKPARKKVPVARKATTPKLTAAQSEARRQKLLADARERKQRRAEAAFEAQQAAAQRRNAAHADVRKAQQAEVNAQQEALELAQQQKALDEKNAAADAEQLREQQLQEQQRLAQQEELAAEQAEVARQREEQQALAQQERDNALSESADAVVAGDAEPTIESPSLSAFRLPPAVRQSAREFGYIDALPINYDFGGGGLMLQGSAGSHERFRYVAKAGVASTYSEAMVGAGYYMTPKNADRVTMVVTAGVEYGKFDLSDEATGEIEVSDSGVYVGFMSRLVINRQFELQTGIGYSSFFGGDPHLMGAGFYHINRRLDIFSRFEAGDNDNLGVGVRYYY